MDGGRPTIEASQTRTGVCHRISSIQLLPEDASLIEVHVSHAHQAVTASLLDDSHSVSESLHLRATILSSILFQLAILQLQNLSANDPFAAAKKGGIIRHSTVPEIVLQTPESDHEGIPTPFRWCKMRTILRKTAAVRIPAGFVLATAYLEGQEYNWNSTSSPTTINSLTAMPLAYEFSSPLSDPPPSQTKSINPVLQSGLTAEDIEMGAIGCKRKWEEGPGEEGGPEVHPAETVNAAVGKRVNLAVVMASDGKLTYVPYVNFPYRLPGRGIPGLSTVQHMLCTAIEELSRPPSERHSSRTAVTSTRLSSDISMGYCILDLNVTLRLYQDPETPKAEEPCQIADAKSFLGSSGGKTVQTDIKHHQERGQIWEHGHGE
ncbi:hypothetical protein C8J57DRAFT_1259133 [Mycena rebaudengoi]|nr:hypothetical protein C8J57DRAFT_1259133 [Mycena rebaudengoi]